MAGVSLRLRTLSRRSSLDAALAEGADPAEDPALALRAQQLTAPATRRAIAGTIRNLVNAAEEPGRPWTRGGLVPRCRTRMCWRPATSCWPSPGVCPGR